MYAGKLVFAQLTDLIHPEQFRRCVRRYNEMRLLHKDLRFVYPQKHSLIG